MESTIKERPILFSGPMVKAILDGKKTQTRRIVKRQPVGGESIVRLGGKWMVGQIRDSENAWRDLRCPYGNPEDRLWVRETWKGIGSLRPSGYWSNPELIGKNYWYRATDCLPTWGGTKWRPSIFMPRDACRIVLEITDVRVQRLQEITEEDAIAEGAQCAGFPASLTDRGAFAKLWDKLNAKRGFGWDQNPWVWAVTFKRV